MNLTPLQADFSAGEISPLMINRTALEGHGKAADTMENCIALSQGPFKNRDPFRFVAEITGFNTGVIRTLQVSPDRFLAAVFVDLQIFFFYSDGSPVILGHAVNPRFSDFGDGWEEIVSDAQSFVEFVQHACTLTPKAVGALEFAAIRQEVTIIDGSENHDFIVNSDVETNFDELRLMVGTTAGGTELVDAIVTTNNASINFDPVGNLVLFIEVQNINIVGGFNPVTLSVVDLVRQGAPGVSEPTPYPAAALSELKFIEAPVGDSIYITHPNFPQHFLIFDDLLGAITFGEVDFGETAPVEWMEDNFPSTGVVHGSRIYYMASPNEPEQIWAGVIGDFEDMTQGTEEADGFSVINEHFGKIEWALSTNELVFGTENGEYLVTSQGVAIFIGDIDINRQSTYGSASIQARQIGDRILYITRDGRRLHAMQFNRDNQTWLSDEISFPSEHITKAVVKEMIWEQYPHDLIWMLLRDGTMACCNYNRPMEIFGFHRHNTPGTVISFAAGNDSGESIIAALIQRESSGSMYLEISAPSGFPMDSRITIQLVPASTTVTGLEHLEGLTVQVIADEALHPTRVVVGGEIELQAEADLVQIGVGYRKRVKTTPLDKGSDKGSARAYVKKYKDIYLGLLDSSPPVVNGQIIPARTAPMLMDEPPPFFTGLRKVTNSGFDREALVDIIQDGPLPLQVTGIYGEVIQEKM